MYILSNVQDALNMQLLANVAEKLLSTVQDTSPEWYLMYRMKEDGGHNVSVDTILSVDVKSNSNRIWIEVEFVYRDDEEDTTGEDTLGYYSLWVVGTQELTGSFEDILFARKGRKNNGV